eukprot:g65511.t1
MGAKDMSVIMFEKFDKDNSGHIDAGEFQQLCFSLGYALTQDESKYAFRTLDADNSGQLDKEEFREWWRKKDRLKMLKLDDAALQVRHAAADVFNEFDPKKEGHISTDNFADFYKHLVDNKLTTKSKEKCLEELDSNGDKNVQFGEYIAWLAKEDGPIKVAALSGIGPEVARTAAQKNLGNARPQIDRHSANMNSSTWSVGLMISRFKPSFESYRLLLYGNLGTGTSVWCVTLKFRNLIHRNLGTLFISGGPSRDVRS